MILESGTKEDVIEIYKEAGIPLSHVIKEDLDYVEEDLKNRSLPVVFAIIDCQCRICSHHFVGIIPAIADLDNMECENCGNMTMQERDIPEWEQGE